MTYEVYEKTTYYIRCDICEDYEEEDSCGEEWFRYHIGRSGWELNATLINGRKVDCCPRCKDLSDAEQLRRWEELNRK